MRAIKDSTGSDIVFFEPDHAGDMEVIVEEANINKYGVYFYINKDSAKDIISYLKDQFNI